MIGSDHCPPSEECHVPGPSIQHNQSCCERPPLYGQHQMGPQRPHFNMIRPPFCRPQNMTTQQGNNYMPNYFQMHYNSGFCMKPNQSYMPNNTSCRMPSNLCPSEFKSVREDVKDTHKVVSRPKKRMKTAFDKNSPSPNVDSRNLCSEDASPLRVGSGPSTPYSLSSQSITQGADSTSSSDKPLTTGPSFMEDPNGYLAQQTALLNNTMSGGVVGQFSPQGPRISPRPPISSPRTDTSNTSPVIVPLPSNVSLPAKVGKASQNVRTTVVSSCSTQPVLVNRTTSSNGEHRNNNSEETFVATAESSSIGQTVTVTYINSTVTTTTSRSPSNSPQPSSQQNEPENIPNKDSQFKSFDGRKTDSLKSSTVPSYNSDCVCSKNSPSLSAEIANKPLTPGPADSVVNTQSPLELVQNIVSSIPLPSSVEEVLQPFPGRSNPAVVPVQASPVSQPQQMQLGSQVYNGMQGVMYNPGSSNSNVLRGASGPLVIHGSSQSLPQGVIVGNNPNMVMVTSPFNSKVSVAAPAICTNVNPAPGNGQTPTQHSITHVQSHLQPIQPVVQFVNTFAAMQAAPVIIQNGSNIIQPNSGGVIGSASILNNSNFVASQPVLAMDSSSHQLQVVTSAEEDTAPVSSTPSESSQGSITPPSGASRKRKRRRNTSTPQNVQSNVMPTIIMGKPQQMVMNGHQISPYGNIATVAGSNVPTMPNGGQMLAPQHSNNPINVVQMVSGPMAAPVHVQQPTQAIIVPSHTTSGVLINQLPDGTFISTDPNTGVSYPVQLQLRESRIVGVTPVSNANVVAPLNNSVSGGAAVMTLQQPQINATVSSAKLVNMSSSEPSHLHQGNQTVPDAVLPTHFQTSSTASASSQASAQPATIENCSSTLLSQKITTMVSQQQTTVVTTARQGSVVETRSSVSTQTNSSVSESDVTSSDGGMANATLHHDSLTISPSHQSAEISTTRLDDYSVSTPESVILTPPHGLSPTETVVKRRVHSMCQEPHSASSQGM